MQLTIALDDYLRELEFTWKPLLSSRGTPCYVWEYHKAGKRDKDIPVVYRHVLQVPVAGIVTIYVGEGSSLNGPQKKNNLRYQYSSGGHGASRVKVRSYVAGRSEVGWTEILELAKPNLDFADDRQRKFMQLTLIAVYYWEHQWLLEQGLNVPEFLNEPR